MKAVHALQWQQLRIECLAQSFWRRTRVELYLITHELVKSVLLLRPWHFIMLVKCSLDPDPSPIPCYQASSYQAYQSWQSWQLSQLRAPFPACCLNTLTGQAGKPAPQPAGHGACMTPQRIKPSCGMWHVWYGMWRDRCHCRCNHLSEHLNASAPLRGRWTSTDNQTSIGRSPKLPLFSGTHPRSSAGRGPRCVPGPQQVGQARRPPAAAALPAPAAARLPVRWSCTWAAGTPAHAAADLTCVGVQVAAQDSRGLYCLQYSCACSCSPHVRCEQPRLWQPGDWRASVRPVVVTPAHAASGLACAAWDQTGLV